MAIKLPSEWFKSYLTNSITKSYKAHTHLLQISSPRGLVPNQTGGGNLRQHLVTNESKQVFHAIPYRNNISIITCCNFWTKMNRCEILEALLYRYYLSPIVLSSPPLRGYVPNQTECVRTGQLYDSKDAQITYRCFCVQYFWIYGHVLMYHLLFLRPM